MSQGLEQPPEIAGYLRTISDQLIGRKGFTLCEANDQGMDLRLYGPHRDESVDDIAVKLAKAAQNDNSVPVCLVENLPMVALAGDTAESIKLRWQTLGMLSKSVLKVKETDDLFEASPEQVRESIAQQCQRIAQNAQVYSDRRNGHLRSIDWTKEKAILPFYFRGPATPQWLRFVGIQMASDASVLTQFPDPIQPWTRHNYLHPDPSGNPVYLLDSYYLEESYVIPRDQPFTHHSAKGVETLQEYYARMNSLGKDYDYKEVDQMFMKHLLLVMQQIEPIKFYDYED